MRGYTTLIMYDLKDGQPFTFLLRTCRGEYALQNRRGFVFRSSGEDVLHNMLVILVKRNWIKVVDITEDGTGFSLMITKHYRGVRKRKGEKAKSNEEQSPPDTGTQSEEKKRKKFAYAFAIMDLGTWTYVGYGFSMRSEKRRI